MDAHEPGWRRPKDVFKGLRDVNGQSRFKGIFSERSNGLSSAVSAGLYENPHWDPGPTEQSLARLRQDGWKVVVDD